MKPVGRRVARSAVVAAIAAALAGCLSGCASAITDVRIENSMRTSFSNLYTLQQHQRGLPVEAVRLNTVASCDRGSATQARGPGDDWVCNVTWRTETATTGAAVYSLNVHPDGCYSADGDGPVDLNGSATLVDLDGRTVLNPLWAFDGCFPLS